MDDSAQAKCIGCGKPLREPTYSGLRVETPFGVITCFYHRACYEACSTADHTGDVYRLAAGLIRTLEQRRDISATVAYRLPYRPEDLALDLN